MAPISRVIGIGVDIIEVGRIRELMERKGDRLHGRVFTDIEMDAFREDTMRN